MKKNLKITYVSILALIFAFSMIISVIGITSNKAHAETQALETFQLIDGAYIREEEPLGLRFEAAISTAEKESLPEGATFGMLITLDTHLNGAELTDEIARKIDIKTNNWRSKSSLGDDYSGYYSTVAGGTGENTVDFEPEHYSDVFVARGYVKDKDGNIIAYTSNTVERTLAGSVAMAKEVYEANQEEVPQIYENILANENSEKVTLTYSADGATNVPTTTELYKGQVLDGASALNAEISRDDDLFGGWFYDEAFTNQAFKREIIKTSTTVYGRLGDTLDYGAAVLSAFEPNHAKYSYVKEDMTGEDARENTYKLTTEGETEGSRLAIAKSNMGYAFAEGNYLVIDAYMADRQDATCRFRYFTVFEEYEGAYYLVKNEPHTESQVSKSVWYKIVIPVSEISKTDGVYHVTLSSGDKLCTVYVSNVSLINATTYTELFKQEAKPVVDTGIYTYDATLFYQGHSATAGVTYEATAMPDTTDAANLRTGTYKWKNTAGAERYLYISTENANGKLVSGNYLVFEAYIEVQAEAERFRFCTYVFDMNNNLIDRTKNESATYPYGVAPKTWYKVAIPVASLYQGTRVPMGDKNSEIFISGATIYTAEKFAETFPSAS